MPDPRLDLARNALATITDRLAAHRDASFVCSQCGERLSAMVKVGTSDGWCLTCLDAAAEPLNGYDPDPPRPQEIAWYVLRQFGDATWPKPGSFYEALVDTAARADPVNLARLATAFPTLARYVRTAQMDPTGMDQLRAIAASSPT